MGTKSRHVVPNPNGGWSVRQSGAKRASRNFDTQKEAVKFGRGLARKEHTEFYLHRKDGTIREKDSYGADSYPPRDKH